MTWAAIGVLLVLVPACSGFLPVCWEKECNFPSYACQKEYTDPSYFCQKPTYGITKYSFSANQQNVTWNTQISGRTITSKVLRLCIIWLYTCNAAHTSFCFHIRCDTVPDSPVVLNFENYSIPNNLEYPQVQGGDDIQMLRYVCVQRQPQLTEVTYDERLLYDLCVTTRFARPVIGNIFSVASEDQKPHLKWNGRKHIWE